MSNQAMKKNVGSMLVVLAASLVAAVLVMGPMPLTVLISSRNNSRSSALMKP